MALVEDAVDLVQRRHDGQEQQRERQHVAAARLCAVAESDLSATSQDQLFAADQYFLFAIDGHIRAIRALVDEDELVAPPFDACMHTRRHAITDHDVALQVAAERQCALRFGELDLALTQAKPDLRGLRRRARGQRRKLVGRFLPEQLADPDVFGFSLDGQ